MNKFYFSAITLGLVTFLTGCDKYDIKLPKTLETKEFYIANMEKAQEVSNQCEQLTVQLKEYRNSLTDRTEQKEFEMYMEENGLNTFIENCQNAKNGLYEAEQKAEEERQKAEKAEREANLEKARLPRREKAIKFVTDLEASFSADTWQKSISKIINSKWGKELNNYQVQILLSESNLNLPIDQILSNSNESIQRLLPLLSNYIESDNSRYKFNGFLEKEEIIKFIYARKKHLGLQELSTKPYEELAKDTSYCKTDRRELSVCDIWKESLQERKQDVVKGYLSNYDKLKTDYNQCVAQLEEYLSSVNVGKNDRNVPIDIYNGIKKKENEIYNSYPCSEAKDALKKLNISFDHYEKLD